MAGTEDFQGVEVGETGQGRYQVKVRAASGEFLADEPVAAGGLGSGPNPYELMAAALGACTAMTLRMYAERKAWPLDSVVVRVLHRREGLEAKDRFAREIVLAGRLSDQQRARLKEIAEKCPVHRTLERGSVVTTVLAETPIDACLDGAADYPRDMAEACAD